MRFRGRHDPRPLFGQRELEQHELLEDQPHLGGRTERIQRLDARALRREVRIEQRLAPRRQATRAAHGRREGIGDGLGQALERDTEAVRALRETLPDAWVEALDVTDRDGMRDLVARVVRHHGRVDVLVNNAVAYTERPAHACTDEEWEDTIDSALSSVFRACRAVLSDSPRCVVATVYTKGVTAKALAAAIDSMMAGLDGRVEIGELATVERSAGRVLHNALYARWQADRISAANSAN
jgi:NAD(P)-dependent dehydrogenase (short-subunit alcohol dehydrogenase family)